MSTRGNNEQNLCGSYDDNSLIEIEDKNLANKLVGVISESKH